MVLTEVAALSKLILDCKSWQPHLRDHAQRAKKVEDDLGEHYKSLEETDEENRLFKRIQAQISQLEAQPMIPSIQAQIQGLKISKNSHHTVYEQHVFGRIHEFNKQMKQMQSAHATQQERFRQPLMNLDATITQAKGSCRVITDRSRTLLV